MESTGKKESRMQQKSSSEYLKQSNVRAAISACRRASSLAKKFDLAHKACEHNPSCQNLKLEKAAAKNALAQHIGIN